MLSIFSFFDETQPTTPTSGGWTTYLFLGVLLVGMVCLMIIPQRKQRKRAEEMMSKLAVGCIVTTIGGIIGEVVRFDDKHIWIATGLDTENRVVMQLLRQAIHSIVPSGSDQTSEQGQANQEVDEIK